mmetsp:Transcript_4951/g.15525  ORF Transcript_4951/g.15525 Transcript_4951/m.15525 type:complete len:266 (-) Transcript_4951:321-1118(-)
MTSVTTRTVSSGKSSASTPQTSANAFRPYRSLWTKPSSSTREESTARTMAAGILDASMPALAVASPRAMALASRVAAFRARVVVVVVVVAAAAAPVVVVVPPVPVPAAFAVVVRRRRTRVVVPRGSLRRRFGCSVVVVVVHRRRRRSVVVPTTTRGRFLFFFGTAPRRSHRPSFFGASLVVVEFEERCEARADEGVGEDAADDVLSRQERVIRRVEVRDEGVEVVDRESVVAEPVRELVDGRADEERLRRCQLLFGGVEDLEGEL